MAAALAAVAYAAAPATATGHVQTSNGASSVNFYSDGEKFKVCDLAADGHSAVARVTRSDRGSTVYRVWHYKGAGGCSTYNYSMPEGTDVKYRACLGSYGNNTIWGCSVEQDDEA
ncbi:hypothetical protein ABZ400_35975 [Streptomyces sp. NPDC005897]|uniref:hypothetical protein n=1 Tax=Streptomyces sp. NPDC005897 TaxID=3157081 RepID=UPI0033F9B2C1